MCPTKCESKRRGTMQFSPCERDETRRAMHTGSKLRRKCKQFLARVLMEPTYIHIDSDNQRFGVRVCLCGKPLLCRLVLIILNARAVPLAGYVVMSALKLEPLEISHTFFSGDERKTNIEMKIFTIPAALMFSVLRHHTQNERHEKMKKQKKNTYRRT